MTKSKQIIKTSSWVFLAAVMVLSLVWLSMGGLNTLATQAFLRYNQVRYDSELRALHQEYFGDDQGIAWAGALDNTVALYRLDPDTEHDSDCVCCC